MIFSGKNINEALAMAEHKMGKKRNEFNYKVLEQKKSFFKSNEVQIEILGLKVKGSIEIKTGKAIVSNGELLPSIEPGENIRVTINGKVISARTQVRESDEIIIEALNSNLQRNINIIVSEDKMEAYAEISYTPKRIFTIPDYEKTDVLRVEAEIVEESFPPQFSKDEFEAFLLQNRIKYGIKWENLASILRGNRGIIASGFKPVEPIDDKIEYFFNSEIEKKPVEIQGKVDYYNIGKIDFVERNQILALRHEGRDGETGFDVYGNVINPPKRNILKLSKGKGCDLVENGNKAIALERGMPSIKSNRVCVYPGHVVQGDVDLKTGNISFEGDVNITGSVKEGLKVTSGNNLTIAGDVENSKLISGGNITIGRSIIGSSIQAGIHQLSDKEALMNLQDLKSFLESLLKALHMVDNSRRGSGNYTAGHLIKVLIESKFQGFKAKVAQGLNFVKNNKVEDKISGVWSEFIDIYRDMVSGTLNDTGSINHILSIITDTLVDYEINMAPADILLNYSQNSEIIASRDVEVSGKGCYNTIISAENEVRFTGYAGVFRGGDITAGKSIRLSECGSSAGVKTVLKTSKHGIIEIKRAYQNTILCFDELIYRLDNPAKSVKAYVSKGEIFVEKLKF